MPVRPDDIDLTAFPVVVLHNLASGITSVKPDFPFGRPDEVRPERILQQIDACRITTASGPPAYWSAIAKYCLAMHRTLPLRRIIAGGAVSAPALIRELSQIAPYAAVLSIYGSTEAEPVAIISADEYLENVTAQAGDGAGIPLGRPIPEIDVRILDRDGADCGADRVGEIWVSGDHVARNYSSNPAAQSTEKRLDGADRLWHRMGDVGHRDKTGMLWLAGRVDTTVMRDGREIHPVPVETVAATLPYVARAALIGVPDAQSGERCVLFVEVASDASRPDDWRDQLRGLCAQHKWIIDEIRPIRRLPVDARHHSRIDYRRLKSLATR
jgi:acyl-CoA synthetase (AMP-forming)/AMP-acid ligase II